MLDFADMIVLNKFEKRGAEDALRDVRKQWRQSSRSHEVAGRRGAGVPDRRQPFQ
jgi:methylmalonyl-CoA mutase